MPAPWRVVERRGAVALILASVAVVALAGAIAWTAGLEPGPSRTQAALGSSPSPTATQSPSLMPSATPLPTATPLPAVTATPPSTPPNASSPTPAESAGPPAAFALHVPVLYYHRIIPPALAPTSRPSLVVPPQVFEAQMAALAGGGWQTITLEQLAADLAAGHQPPGRTFVITFDDGYDDGYTYALPILQRFGFVATYFVVTGRIGHPENLTPEHVLGLVAAGMEIGNHTMDHVYLPSLSASRLRYEVESAQRAMTDLTGQVPVDFAYPFGGVNATVIAELDRVGVQLAVTTVRGVAETWPGRFVVPRLQVGPGTSPEYLLATLQPWAAGPRAPGPPVPVRTPEPRLD